MHRTRTRVLATPDGHGADVGTAAHRLVGHVATYGRDLPPADRHSLLWTAAGDLFPDRSMARRGRSGRMSAVGRASAYAARFLPPRSWRLLGVEYDLDEAGVVDLAWSSETGVVLYDELKTGPGRLTGPASEEDVAQAARYAASGADRHAAFGGVRLLYLVAPRASLLVRPDGSAMALAVTPYLFGDDEEVAA
jgi:hypothetical protein